MTLTAYYYFNNENRKFRPFVGLGAGIYDTELLISEYTDVARTTLYMTTMVSEEITGYHFGLGGEYWFNRDWSIRGEGRFINADETFNLLTDAKFARTGLTHDAIKTTLTPKYSGNVANDDLEIDLGGIDVSFSINYFFK
jgi:outer membrane protein W